LCLLPVAFGNTDPAVGDPVQIDQVVDLDLARRSKTGDHLLGQ
jgi:hypothetical protein